MLDISSPVASTCSRVLILLRTLSKLPLVVQIWYNAIALSPSVLWLRTDFACRDQPGKSNECACCLRCPIGLHILFALRTMLPWRSPSDLVFSVV